MPHFGSQAIERIIADHVAAYMPAKAAEGLATKIVSNHLNFAHGLFGFAVRRGWMATNPVAAVDRPRPARTDPDIRYLDGGEVEALLRAVPDDVLGPTDHALYLRATMTGLRQGELAALRSLDIDWAAGVVRGAAQLHARALRNTEDAAVKPRGADGGPRCGGA